MDFKISRVAVQKAYSNLINLEDLTEKFCFVSGGQISSNNGMHPIFGATFYFFITQNAMILNYQELQAVIDILSTSTSDQEILALTPLLTILNDIIALIAQTQSAHSEAEKAQYSDQAKNAIMNLDNSFFSQDCFSTGTCIASSFVFMSKIAKGPFTSQQRNMYNTLLMNNLSTMHKCQFELICQLLNISCAVYQEFQESSYIAPLFSYAANESPQKHALILSEDGNSIRFAFNSTIKNKEDFVINELFLMNQEIKAQDLLIQSLSQPDPQSQELIKEIAILSGQFEQIDKQNEDYKKQIQNALKFCLELETFSSTCLQKKKDYVEKIQELKQQLNRI